MLRLIFALLMLVTTAQAQPLTGALGPQPGPGDPAGAATAAVNAAIPATIGTTSPACGAGVAGGPLAACGASTVLPTGTTIATPSAGDNSTKLATTAFVAPAFAPLFGTGADGTVSCSSGTTTLARDMQYANLTISGTCSINENGWRLYVSQKLDISNMQTGGIYRNGVAGIAASGATGGSNSTPTVGITTPTEINGGAPNAGYGGTGNTTTGTAPSGGSNVEQFIGGAGGNGGNGGTGISAGASGGTPGIFTYITALYFTNPNVANFSYFDYRGLYNQLITPGETGGGGGQGGGDATNAGGGGGSSSRAGGAAVIYANTIARGTNSNTAIIQAKALTGGAGANGVAGNAGAGGGGGGGGGGFVYIVAGSLTGSVIANAIDVSGGTGGTGGNGAGTGKGGNGGTGGNSGNVQVLVLSQTGATTGITNGQTASAAGFNSTTFNGAGTAGSTTSTSTGAAGGSGATMQVGL